MPFLRPLAIALLVYAPFSSFSQSNPPKGFFTSESSGVSVGEQVFITIKKYNPTPEQIEQATHPKKNAPLDYLQLPAIATRISFRNREFESKLYCLDANGNITWEKTTGFSKRSTAAPIATSGGFIYTGGTDKEKNGVTIQKYDLNGKLAWEKMLDSVECVNAITVHENKVNALISFDHSEKITNRDGTYSFKTYPIYFFVQLDPASGNLLKKEYQMMGNYLSSIGYDNPLINSFYSYYLNNQDSAIFLNVAKQDGATVVSESMPKENKIMVLTAGEASNHYITEQSKGKNKNSYHLFSDFYGQKKKYDTDLPVTFAEKDINRCFIQKTSGDSILSIIQKMNETTICLTDPDGHTEVYKQVGDTGTILTGTLLKGSRPVLIWLEGRNSPGSSGMIKIKVY